MKILIIGYGSLGSVYAYCLKKSGYEVIISTREGKSKEFAKRDGFLTLDINESVNKADIIFLMVPDEVQKEVYDKNILNKIKYKTLVFAHGFSITYKLIKPLKNFNTILLAPNAIASMMKRDYDKGIGIPGMIAIHENSNNKELAKEIAFKLAKALNIIKITECTFEEETNIDLFSEQVVLCGGLIELIKKSYEVLIEAGYKAEMAYYAVFHELKMVNDTLHKFGPAKMSEIISNTAEWGMYETGPKIINENTKINMKKVLKRIESGKFTQEFIKEYKNDFNNLLGKRKKLSSHDIEKIRNKILKEKT